MRVCGRGAAFRFERAHSLGRLRVREGVEIFSIVARFEAREILLNEHPKLRVLNLLPGPFHPNELRASPLLDMGQGRVNRERAGHPRHIELDDSIIWNKRVDERARGTWPEHAPRLDSRSGGGGLDFRTSET